MREGYGVIVTHNGEPILTIERTMLSGKSELTDMDAGAIREAAAHLIAFIGPEREGERCRCDHPHCEHPH